MSRILLPAITAIVLVSGGLAYAQRSTVDITFPFVAGDRPLAAGKYTLDTSVRGSISISGPGGKVSMIVLTRLGRHDRDQDAELVFDKTDGQARLSEIWPAGNEDGYLVLATKGEHEHAVVGGSNPKK